MFAFNIDTQKSLSIVEEVVTEAVIFCFG